MKNMLTMIVALLLFTGCRDEQHNEKKTSIYGTWQLIESYVVNGVKGEWKEIENGYQYDIRSNMAFVSTEFSECTEGVIILSNGSITFNYECEGFTAGIESPLGSFTYQYSFFNGKLSLTPTFLTCDEGCGYRFKKIAEPRTAD